MASPIGRLMRALGGAPPIRALPPPHERIYRRFLYIDRDLVLNALSFIQGGEDEEVVTKAAGGFDLSAKLSLPALVFSNVDLGGGATRSNEEQIRRRRTVQGAIGILLSRLRRADDLRSYRPGDVAASAAEQKDPCEGELIEFSGFIELCPDPAADREPHRAGPVERLRGLFGAEIPTHDVIVQMPDDFLASVRIRPDKHALLQLRAAGLPDGGRLRAAEPSGGAAPGSVAGSRTAGEAFRLRRRVTVIGQVEIVPCREGKEKGEEEEEGDPTEELLVHRLACRSGWGVDVHKRAAAPADPPAADPPAADPPAAPPAPGAIPGWQPQVTVAALHVPLLKPGLLPHGSAATRARPPAGQPAATGEGAAATGSDGAAEKAPGWSAELDSGFWFVVEPLVIFR